MRALRAVPALLALALVAAAGTAASGPWRPAPGTSFQWQLTGRVDLSVEADVYDIDLFESPASVVRALHARGRKVICYLSAGSWEPGRPDSARFPQEAIGRPLAGWPDERWLDVRRLDLLGPILHARLDLCRAKGFDGVEFDNVDAYAARSGFPLAARDQLRFNRWLAREAHRRGLSAGLKNDHAQARALEPSFDWALVEECFEYGECEAFRPFVAAGKAVFDVEYRLAPARFCAGARRLGFTAIRKRLALDAWRAACA